MNRPMLPLVVSLNCLENCGLEQESLVGIAEVEYVGLSNIGEGRIESASAVLIHSLAFLPRAAQRRLQPGQIILCLGSVDRTVDSTLAADLGLHLVHVDVSRAEEIADTIMALFLGLLRKTHVLSRHAFSMSGWLGSVQPLFRGMRRSRGLVVGIVGKSASARALATRCLAFKMNVLYFDIQEGKRNLGGRISFPSAARRLDTLNDLLAASDLISLHCALSDATVQIINAECLQHIKPGSFIINTASSHLLDDCALKQLLIDGTIAGCALDGAEGPQWMEAWVKELPNVLILPRSADYSEEVWIEIREKAILVLRSFFLDGVSPTDAVSGDEDETKETQEDDTCLAKRETEQKSFQVDRSLEDEVQARLKCSPEKCTDRFLGSHVSYNRPGKSLNAFAQCEGGHSRSDGGKRDQHCKPKQKYDNSLFEQKNSCPLREDSDMADTGQEQNWSSISGSTSPEVAEKIQERLADSTVESYSGKKFLNCELLTSEALLKDGYVIALHVRDKSSLFVSRQRKHSRGWLLDTMSNVTKRDPAAQFLVTLRSKGIIGLRSFAAGGKLLQVNGRMELVFSNHNFDIGESWMLEGHQLEECKLVNCRNHMVVLDVSIEILAAVGEEDGVVRWLSS